MKISNFNDSIFTDTESFIQNQRNDISRGFNAGIRKGLIDLEIDRQDREYIKEQRILYYCSPEEVKKYGELKEKYKIVLEEFREYERYLIEMVENARLNSCEVNGW